MERDRDFRVPDRMNEIFTTIASRISAYSGKAVTFVLAILIIVVWAATGPLFGYSDTWQLVVNTGTTIITFMMVFLIQNTQNRDSAALQAKVDELLRAVRNAREDKLVGVEHLTDEEIEKIRGELERAAARKSAKSNAAKARKNGKAKRGTSRGSASSAAAASG